MPDNARSKQRRSKEKPMETDVILIVKGAGEQAEDDHLNIFLRGFWPAVKSLDKNATIQQVSVDEAISGSSPHNDQGNLHRHLTEIRAKLPDPKGEDGKYAPRRIWLRESYWEDEVLSSSGLSNLSREWHMSSHVFANMVQDLFFTRDSNDRKDTLKGVSSDDEENMLRAGETPEENVYKEFLRPSEFDFWGSYFSYTLLFLLTFLPLVLAPFIEPGRISFLVKGIFPAITLPASLSVSETNGIAAALVFALIWAVAPARELSKMINLRFESQSNQYLKRLPGLPSWTLVLLILLLLTFPVSYLVTLLFVSIVQISLLFARRILWDFRYYSNSDVDKAKDYYEYKVWKDGAEQTRIGEVDEWWFLRVPFSPLFYRYLIFLALPIGFLVTSVAGFLKWTRIFGGLGEALDGAIKFLLVGYMADVVNYAMDPVQAHRVRSIVMEDIKRYHNLEGVQRIHIVAHSQGTPITFETLFHYLEPEYQSKIYTYVTLGSVLGYYYQARGALDPVYYNRFKMPIRRDKFPGWATPRDSRSKKYPKSPRYEFKWLNFWNFTDPITEFYGLDEYNWFNGEWTIDKDTQLETPARGFSSPTNIRTSSSLAKNHGEYWDNLDKFQKPFAKRVLGDFRPEEWNREKTRRNWLIDRIGHHAAVFLIVPVILALLVGAGFVAYWLFKNNLAAYIADMYNILKNAFNQVFPSSGGEQTMLQRLFDPAMVNYLKQFWSKILAGSLIVLGIWAVIDWINQGLRTSRLGKQGAASQGELKESEKK